MTVLIGAAAARGVLTRNGLMVVILLMACVPDLARAECEKSVRWDDDPPFSMTMPNGDVSGIDVDLGRAVLERMGCSITLRKLPWARALRELELGRLDILPGAFRRPERAQYAHFSGTVLPASRNILFMNEKAHAKWPVSRLIDLRDTEFRLGAQIRVYYGPDYQELMNDPAFAARVTFLANRENLWRMLERGRIDGVIANEHTGAYEISQLGLGSQIKATTVVVSDEPAEVAFSKASNTKAFARRYAQVLQQLVADGSYQHIVQRYVPAE